MASNRPSCSSFGLAVKKTVLGPKLELPARATSHGEFELAVLNEALKRPTTKIEGIDNSVAHSRDIVVCYWRSSLHRSE
jgi:hypothetical protein